MKNTAVILINIGTPDSYNTKDVRAYLSRFLNDKRVITLPYILRKILVNMIIVPFRAPKSAKLYKLLWQDDGSPLQFYSERLISKLNADKSDNTQYFLAMSYGRPFIKDVLDGIRQQNFDSIIIFPMFPQYASSTSGSIIELVLSEISKWNIIPEVRTISQYHSHSAFIDSFANSILSCEPDNYEHLIFSYHGLPLDQINDCHSNIPESTCECTKSMPKYGKYCYKATCYETTRLMVEKLNLSADKYSVGFQSRLSKNWLMPFTDEIILQKAIEGVKKLLIIAPAFVTDCLETLVELEIEYSELFKENGGEELKLVPSQNDSDMWAAAIQDIIGIK